MGVHVFVGVGVAFGCGFAQARCTADNRFIDMLPEALRPHEGFVVKAAGNEARELAVDGTDIKGE